MNYPSSLTGNFACAILIGYVFSYLVIRFRANGPVSIQMVGYSDHGTVHFLDVSAIQIPTFHQIPTVH